MIVTLDPALFAAGGASADQLYALFAHAYDGRHRVEVDETDASVGAWLEQQSPMWRQAWEDARDQNLREAPLDVLRRRVLVAPTQRDDLKPDPPVLMIATALRVLRLPLRILVENGRTDGGRFLRRASAIGQRDERLKRFLDEGWLEFDSAGGNSEISEVIKSSHANPAWRLRHYAVFDSDALRPGEPSPTAATLLRRCKKFDVPHHCLARRSAENYLPPAALEHLWAAGGEERLQRVDAYRELDQPGGRAERRHHYAMKKGLDGAAHDDGLYADVPEARRKVLARGFGGSIRDVFGESHPDWERWLLDDGQGDEVGGMLDEIFSFR